MVNKHQPTDGERGGFESLKHGAVDNSDIDDDPKSTTFGQPRFLLWTVVNDTNTGKQSYRAIGKDGKVYTIVDDTEPQLERKGKMIVTQHKPKGENENLNFFTVGEGKYPPETIDIDPSKVKAKRKSKRRSKAK